MSSKVTRKIVQLVQQFTKAVTAAVLKAHAKQLEMDTLMTGQDFADATAHVNALRAQLNAAERDVYDLCTVHCAKCREVAVELKQLGIGE